MSFFESVARSTLSICGDCSRLIDKRHRCIARHIREVKQKVKDEAIKSSEQRDLLKTAFESTLVQQEEVCQKQALCCFLINRMACPHINRPCVFALCHDAVRRRQNNWSFCARNRWRQGWPWMQSWTRCRCVRYKTIS